RHAAGATPDDWRRLRDAWGESFDANLAAIKRDECRIVLRLIGGSHLGYARNASRWWMPVAAAMDDLGARDAPIYFVSSNAHSLGNVRTGVARRIEDEIVDWIGRSDRDLDTERRKLEAGHSRASRQNWLYYGARQVFDASPDRDRLRKWRAELEAANGIRHIAAVHRCRLGGAGLHAVEARRGSDRSTRRRRRREEAPCLGRVHRQRRLSVGRSRVSHPPPG